MQIVLAFGVAHAHPACNFIQAAQTADTVQLRIQRTYTDTRTRQPAGREIGIGIYIDIGFDIAAAHCRFLRPLHRFIVIFRQSVDQNDNAGLVAGVVITTSNQIT
ncbi:hypothetical protein [Xanthomonas oryzae]|uniref:Uncharacterized protein n=1 Tax=Xanthomonas oryzae pv. leersiae TaxID=3112258 RepID=A0AAJ6GY57_9XANT|nr:hypothetical protein [Xanthomonas oryzae]UNE64868.1 hypothetical protein MML47_08620 [Xanthomonas oryzae]WIX08734.1 hypothetical protein QN060_14215 [Xanthomonas oryzae pv. oryzae]